MRKRFQFFGQFIHYRDGPGLTLWVIYHDAKFRAKIVECLLLNVSKTRISGTRTPGKEHRKLQ